MNPLSIFITFLFPQHCVECGESGAYVCEQCLSDIERVSFSPLYNEGLHSLFPYQNKVVQKSIVLAKYKRVFMALYPFAKPLAEMIFEFEKRLGVFDRPIILVPIPSTKTSFRKRGFSQTEVLAHYIAKLYPNNFSVTPILIRLRRNKKQTECASRVERIKNMEGIFAVKNRMNTLPHAVYVILDDVITTGATMRAAQSALTKAGARTVIGVSIAYQELH